MSLVPLLVLVTLASYFCITLALPSLFLGSYAVHLAEHCSSRSSLSAPHSIVAALLCKERQSEERGETGSDELEGRISQETITIPRIVTH